jgi:ParB family chromosome partitioning protein
MDFMKRQWIDIDRIDLRDERFRTSFFPFLDKMKVSLRKVGLLQSPVVQKRGGRVLLISGWKRVLACRALSISPLEVIVSKGGSDLEIFKRGFFENLATREFPLVEKAEIAARLKKFGESKKRLREFYLPLMGIHPTAAHLEILLSLAMFEPSQKEMIAAKDMPLQTIERLAEFRNEEVSLILPWLVPLGQNNQKELIEDLFETSRRDDKTVKDFLEAEEIQEILMSPKLPVLQKSEKLKDMLRKKRYPEFSRWSEAFDAVRRKLPWPKGVLVKSSPFFEEDELSLSFRFKTKKEFQAGLSRLQKLAAARGFSRLFREP